MKEVASGHNDLPLQNRGYYVQRRLCTARSGKNNQALQADMDLTFLGTKPVLQR
jgi:hypothetical protein